MKHIPNFITSLNLASGFIAIILLFNGEPVMACWMLAAAMIFDFFDGFASRLLNAYSDMGKELDSLADLVSFGVVPGMIIYQLLSASHNSTPVSIFSDPLNLVFIFISALMPVCAGLRLAKFNTDTTQKTSFKGLPTPASALAVISVAIAGRYGNSPLTGSLMSSTFAIIVFSLVLSLLMVTRISLLSLKFTDFGLRDNLPRYVLILVSVLLMAILGAEGIMFIIPSYIIVSLISDLTYHWLKPEEHYKKRNGV